MAINFNHYPRAYDGFVRVDYHVRCGCHLIFHCAPDVPAFGPDRKRLGNLTPRRPYLTQNPTRVTYVDAEFFYCSWQTTGERCDRCSLFPRSPGDPFNNNDLIYRKPVVRLREEYTCEHPMHGWELLPDGTRKSAWTSKERRNFGLEPTLPPSLADVPANLSGECIGTHELTPSDIAILVNGTPAQRPYSGTHIDAEFMFSSTERGLECLRCRKIRCETSREEYKRIHLWRNYLLRFMHFSGGYGRILRAPFHV